LKIKNIRQYRTQFKSIRPVRDDLDEHAIGNFYDDDKNQLRKWGWFSIVHGDKDGKSTPRSGISNFLQSFLDMAKDGQAVYEFLQNAVDAESSHFTMVWGQDEEDGNNYLLAANNGRMFDYDNIGSILNVGASTKSSDSKKIGKFGIGFKLAHRLVGRDNGIDELLGITPSGPILFSWKNYELAAVAKGEEPEIADIEFERTNINDYTINNDHPWLFKILLTSFPCMPENNQIKETVRMIDGVQSPTSPFKKSEYLVLSRWVNKYLNVLSEETYKEGSLFFLKLGPGKVGELNDKNLAEGVKFSIAILQETAEDKHTRSTVLEAVQLNQMRPITRPDLNYHNFNISKINNLDDYLFIRFGIKASEPLSEAQELTMEKEDDIEVLFGYRNHDQIGEYFESVPNFYLFFPLSEEVHNFNFILHSNAFYKASSRTFLHKGSIGEGGINERLLRTIAKRLRHELRVKYLAGSHEDRKDFLSLYAALLTSSESIIHERKWIKEPFIDELKETLKSCIPVRESFSENDYKLSVDGKNIYWKDTDVNIDLSELGLDEVSWFYWKKGDDSRIKGGAQEKLGVRIFDIIELLRQPDVSEQINHWIEEDRSRVKIILTELNLLVDRQRLNDVFKSNLSDLNLFQFSDDQLFSISGLIEAQEDGYIILHNKLASIKPELQKCGINTSILDLDKYQFYYNFNSYLSPDSQLRSQPTLIKIFSNSIAKKSSINLSKQEKLKIFRVFRNMIDEGKKTQRLKELRLFSNTTGNPVPMQHLMAPREKDWLASYAIRKQEHDTELDLYLCSKDDEVYARIIYPFWDSIADMIAKSNDEAGKKVLNDIISFYGQNTFTPGEELSLSSSAILLFKGEAKVVERAYRPGNFTSLNPVLYSSIQKTVDQQLNLQIPDQKYIEYFNKAPFYFPNPENPLSFDRLSLGLAEISHVLAFCKSNDLDIFSHATTYQQEDDSFQLRAGDDTTNFFSGEPKINAFISKYLATKLIPLPGKLIDYSGIVHLASDTLSRFLIDYISKENTEMLIELTDALLNEKTKILSNLLNVFKELEFDTEWKNEHQNKILLGLAKRLIQEDDYLESLNEKTVLVAGDDKFQLDSIEKANDAITLSNGEREISISRSGMLGHDNNQGIKQTYKFAEEVISRGFLTKQEADHFFKISESTMTDELIDRFKSSLTENHLENIHQLALVLFSKSIDRNTVNEFQVKANNDNWYPLEGNWVVPSISETAIFNEEYHLSSIYEGLQDLLKLHSFESFRFDAKEESSEDDEAEGYIFPGFLFQPGCTVKILDADCSNLELFKYLYQRWSETAKERRSIRETQPWESIFEFDPKLKIIDSNIVEGEELDDEIIHWLNLDEDYASKAPFLKALGIRTRSSDIVKLRSWLCGNGESYTPSSMENISIFLLSNTLVGMADGFIGSPESSVAFNIDDEKHLFIKNTIERIFQDANDQLEIRVPIHLTLETLRLGSEKDILPQYINEDSYEVLRDQVKSEKFDTLFSKIAIVFRDDLYNDFIEENYEELICDFEFIENISAKEHDDPIYNSWRPNHNLRLIRQSEILYKMSISDSESIIELGMVKKGDIFVQEEDTGYTIYHNESVKLEDLAKYLDEIEMVELLEAVNNLIISRDNALANLYHVLSASGKNELDENSTEKLFQELSKQTIEDERKRIIAALSVEGEEHKYSHRWFELYLEFLLTFESIAETTSQKSVTFQKIKTYKIEGKVSERYFTLEGANSVIPLNIEIFEGFNLSLVFSNREKKSIVVDGVSKKGENLLIYIPEGIESNIIRNFDSIVNIKINFSPVLDLIKRLASSFRSKDIIQPWEDIRESAPPIQFIFGPPGTGKTTTICRMLQDLINRNSLSTALVIVPTNKAGDVLAMKLAAENTGLTVIRLGKATDPELEAFDQDIYRTHIDGNQLNDSNVIISTIHRLPYYQIEFDDSATSYLFSAQANWDLIVFDESSMISLPYMVFALFALSRNHPNAKIIVGGDPMQIPPVVEASDADLEDLDFEDENIYKMLGLNTFKTEDQNSRPTDKITPLLTQFRSVEPVGQLFSEFSYHKLLNHGRDFGRNPKKMLPKDFIEKLSHPICFVDFPLERENSVLMPKKLLLSSYHVYAAILVSELIKHLDKCNMESIKYSIGVISPYKAQSLLMNKLISASGISENITIHCNTVHGFQGDECDIAIFVVNPNNFYHSGHPKALLSKEYIYNVAISRAKDYLWILNPISTISNNQYIQKIQHIRKSLDASGENTVIQSHEIEKEIFGYPNFIVDNSYLTGHDNINIFGKSEMKYFIKAGNTAIDFQLRK
jgi:hypothetical protein